MKMDGRQDSLRTLWMRIQAEEKAGARLRKIIENRRKGKRCINTAPNSAKVILLWMVICFAGNVYQVYEISSQYFMFGITTNLQLVIDDVVEVPSITLCVQLPAIMKWHELTQDQRLAILGKLRRWKYDASHENNETIASISSKFSDVTNILLTMAVTTNIHQNLPIEDIFNASYSYKEVVGMGALYVDKFGPLESDYITLIHKRKGFSGLRINMFDQVLHVSEFLRDIFKCFNFQSTPQLRRVSYYRVMRHPMAPGAISFLFLNSKLMKEAAEILYILTPHGRQMRTGFYSYVQIPTMDEKFHSMTYDTYEEELLEKPYETQCLDYQKLGLMSRGDCYESCVRDFTLTRNASLLPQISIMRNDTAPLVRLSCDYPEKWLLRQADRFCENRCHEKDCLSVAHIPRKLSSKGSPGKQVITTLVPQTPKTKTKCNPAVPLTNFLTDVVSTFGFWMGISAVGVFRFVRRSSQVISKAYLVSEEEAKKQEEEHRQKTQNNSSVPRKPTATTRTHYRDRHQTRIPDYFNTENSYDDMLFRFIIGLPTKIHQHRSFMNHNK